MSDIYAEVDKFKKKLVKATQPNTQKPATSSGGMFATVDLNACRRAFDEMNDNSDHLGPEHLYSTVHSVNAAEVPQERAISQEEPPAAPTDNTRLHYRKRLGTTS